MHQDEAANGCAEGGFAHQLAKVDREVDHRLKQGLGMEFDEIRAYLDGTAINIGHFIGREGSVGSRHQRALICKFHSGNAPFAHALRPQTETKLPEL